MNLTITQHNINRSLANLITMGVTPNNNGFHPTGNQSRNIGTHDGFTENSSTQDISDGSVWTPPHFLQVELY